VAILASAREPAAASTARIPGDVAARTAAGISAAVPLDTTPLGACMQAYAAQGHCCNTDLGRGSAFKLSCLQSCMIRARGTDKPT